MSNPCSCGRTKEYGRSMCERCFRAKNPHMDKRDKREAVIEHQAWRIIELFRAGLLVSELCERFGLGQTDIRNILNKPIGSSDPNYDLEYFYHRHRCGAGQRGIQWEFTFETWWLVWKDSGHWRERGRGKGKYVMSRPGDVGPYAPHNVKIILGTENLEEARQIAIVSGNWPRPRQRKAAAVPAGVAQ